MSLSIQRAEKTVPLCLNLSLKAAHEVAETALREAIANTDRREADTRVADAAARVRRIEEEMRADTVLFTLRAMPRLKWVEFEASHPPREGVEDDRDLSIDVSSLDAVIVDSIVAVEDHDGAAVAFVPASEWGALAEEMSGAQWQPFAIAVLQLNRSVVVAPFSQTASLETLRSAQTSS